MKFPALYFMKSIFSVFVLSLVCIAGAWAGTGGTEFAAAETSVMGMLSGSGGRLVVAFAFIIGGIFAAFTQRYMMAGGGFLLALIVSIGPSVTNSLISGLV